MRPFPSRRLSLVAAFYFMVMVASVLRTAIAFTFGSAVPNLSLSPLLLPLSYMVRCNRQEPVVSFGVRSRLSTMHRSSPIAEILPQRRLPPIRSYPSEKHCCIGGRQQAPSLRLLFFSFRCTFPPVWIDRTIFHLTFTSLLFSSCLRRCVCSPWRGGSLEGGRRTRHANCDGCRCVKGPYEFSSCHQLFFAVLASAWLMLRRWCPKQPGS